MPVRELAKYIIRTGIEAYVIPSNFVKRAARYVPHIYTQKELTVFFDVLDQIQFKRGYPIRHIVLPVIFRLIYCCGLRPSEARELKTENIDLKDGRISILESKGHKDRIVMLEKSLLELCRKYDESVKVAFPNREWFFLNTRGTLYSKRRLEDIFTIYWGKTGIPPSGGNPPRIYDFRHTFVTNRLYRWMQEGKDVSALLPYLSAYLGHSKLSDTAYYIHLVPEFFQQNPNLNLEQYENLLPEVKRW
jgi:integrase